MGRVCLQRFLNYSNNGGIKSESVVWIPIQFHLYLISVRSEWKVLFFSSERATGFLVYDLFVPWIAPLMGEGSLMGISLVALSQSDR